MKIVVYGIHSEEWNRALSKESQLWLNLGVESSVVRILTENTLDKYIEQTTEKLIFIPLIEQNFYKIYWYGNRTYELNFPDFDLFRNFHSKINFETFVKTNNLEEFCPRFYDKNFPQFPVIVKKDFGNSGRGTRIYCSIEDYIEDDIVQEFIPSLDEYVSHLVVNRGTIIKEISFKYCFEKEFHIGGQDPKTCSKYDVPEWVINILGKFLKHYHGVCNVDYKIIEKNVYVMEINPRMGGSLMGKLDCLTEIVRSWMSIIV